MNKVYQACYEIRQDAGGRKGKQCPGGYWIPANKQCGKGGGKGGKMRSPGGMGMGAKAALAAGGLALAGGAAGVAAYKNRDKIIKGVDQAGSKIREKMKERYEEAATDPKGTEARTNAAREQMRQVSRATGAASRTVKNVAKGAEKVVGQAKSAGRRASRLAKVTVEKTKRLGEAAVTSGNVGKAKESLGKQPKKEEAPPQK